MAILGGHLDVDVMSFEGFLDKYLDEKSYLDEKIYLDEGRNIESADTKCQGRNQCLAKN